MRASFLTRCGPLIGRHAPDGCRPARYRLVKVATMNEVVDLLNKARKLIETPDRWCQGDFARDEKGESVITVSPEACKWCMIGALEKAADTLSLDSSLAYSDAREFLSVAVGESILSWWNDIEGRTHTEVLQAFDRAIKLAQGKTDDE